MSNHSHLHEIEVDGKAVTVDAFGTRDECPDCRQKAGLRPLAEVQAELAAIRRGESGGSLLRAPGDSIGGGRAPDEQLLEDLDRAEKDILALRQQLRDAAPAIARERDEAKTEVEQLGRQIRALEKQLEQIPQLEGQLTTARARIAELEAAAQKPKK